MIDTVTLIFKEKDYVLTDKKYFVGKHTKQVNGRFSTTTVFTDMAPQLKKTGVYFPKIEFPSRVSGKDKDEVSYLLVQVSLPKLLYGTSLFEIEGSELGEICQRLSQELKRVKIEVTPEAVANAVVKRVDLCKSIILPPSFGTAKQIIHRLQLFNHKPDSDFTLKEVRDGSKEHFLKYHNSTQGYTVYDKAAEIVANGFTEVERALIVHLRDGKLIRKVLRFELSLQRQQSMDAVLRRHIPGKKKAFTLRDILLNQKAIRNILLEAFDRIYSPANILLVTLSEMKENEIEHHISHLGLSFPRRATLVYLANKTAKYGLKATLAEMKEEMSPSSYNRTKKELKEIYGSLDTLGLEQPNLIQFLRKEHQEFKLLTPNKTANVLTNRV